MILKESHCFYVVKDMTSMPTCYKGDDLPKGFLFFEVNDVNPLNALTFELEDGRLLWDVVCLFSGNINHHADRNAPFLSLNPQTQYWMDNNEVFIQPLRKRGIKVIMCVLGNHDQSGVAQLSDYGCQMFAKELATFCEAYNIDGRMLRRRVFEQSRSFESLLCFAQFGACGPSCLRIEEGDARQACRCLLLL